jgi:hypothetical protein
MRQCQATVDIPKSTKSSWRKGRRCPDDATHSVTIKGKRIRFCWVHLQAKLNERRAITLKVAS